MELNLLTLYVTVFLLHLLTHLSNHTVDFEHLPWLLKEILLCEAETVTYRHSGTSHGTTGSDSHVASPTCQAYGGLPNVINHRIIFVAQSLHNRSKNTRGTSNTRAIIIPTTVGLIQNLSTYF